MENAITVFGTVWCGDCTRVRRLFDYNQIAYTWIDIDDDKRAEDFVISTNRGMRSVPTLLFKDGSTLVEPDEVQLKQLLAKISKAC